MHAMTSDNVRGQSVDICMHELWCSTIGLCGFISNVLNHGIAVAL